MRRGGHGPNCTRSAPGARVAKGEGSIARGDGSASGEEQTNSGWRGPAPCSAEGASWSLSAYWRVRLDACEAAARLNAFRSEVRRRLQVEPGYGFERAADAADVILDTAQDERAAQARLTLA